MNTIAREVAYRLDPVLWVREVLGMTPTSWQEQFLRAPLGASLLVLTARQVGKSTVAAMGLAHTAVFKPGSLSVVACPVQRQSAEAVLKVREMVLKAGAKLTSDNVYGLELDNGSRVLALPGSDDSVRGLTVDGWIIADEAARLKQEIIAALRPMRARQPGARLAMLSTAWTRTDPFWSAWESNGEWIRLKATVDEDPTLFTPEFLAQERINLGEEGFKREYLGIPGGGEVSPFTYELYERAAQTVPHKSIYIPKPIIIAHDVGCTKDRSTAVVGGPSVMMPGLFSVQECKELPQGVYGSTRAETLSRVDQRHGSKTLVVADLSNDLTYAETLFERFGTRTIGVQIGRFGDGLANEPLIVSNKGAIARYKVGRTFLFDLLLRELREGTVRIIHGQESLRAYEQLMALEVEYKEGGIIYKCPSGRHDDLAISLAMLVWAANHPHLAVWCRVLEPRFLRPPRQAPNSAGWT